LKVSERGCRSFAAAFLYGEKTAMTTCFSRLDAAKSQRQQADLRSRISAASALTDEIYSV
jgi:hypothetical protein